MPTYKTPDVYIEEISVFPPSVAEVGTAIPAFIGYTEKARRSKDDDLRLKPTKIYSLEEYRLYFGGPNDDEISLTIEQDANTGEYKTTDFTEPDPKFLMYYAVRMYFDNGGGECYIVSVGEYGPDKVEWEGADGDKGLKDGLDVVAQEDEPTLIVIPESVKLESDDYAELVQAVLKQCGDLKDRFGIFDIYDGDEELIAGAGGSLETNRTHFGMNNLKYGAVYYPFLKTSIQPHVAIDETVDPKTSNVKVTVGAAAEADWTSLETTDTAAYNAVRTELKKHFVIMPPSGAVAGIYAATDGARGVWKAPANVSLSDVIEPLVKITSKKQEDLNVDTTGGKSINALRAFAGKGTLVWGARTLAGNDNEWRYISVRRFFNMVEESVKKSTYWAVFEPNDANTWVKVRGMIENYLIDKWRDGALAGATPKEAFFVKCGLGTTMNAQDILEGRMNVEIGMAVVRPAEFIILKFSHKLQTS
jgi:hypothetical protein